MDITELTIPELKALSEQCGERIEQIRIAKSRSCAMSSKQKRRRWA